MAAKVYFELEPSVGFNTATNKVLKTPILGLRSPGIPSHQQLLKAQLLVLLRGCHQLGKHHFSG